MTDRDILRTHSLRKYDSLVWKEHLRSVGGWMLAVTGLAFAVWLLVIVSGCGGGAASQRLAPVVPPVVSPAPNPPPSIPPPTPTPSAPATLPTHYSLKLLFPLAGGSSAQAEAINAGGDVVGWSMVDGHPEATEWADGRVIDLGRGYALAIAGNQIVGYCTECGAIDERTGQVTGNPIAELWPGGPIGTLAGYDSSEALGVDDDGTVVGVAFVLADPSQQEGWRYHAGLEPTMLPVAGMQVALAIRHGRVAGIGDSFAARVDDRDLPVEGAATAISDAGAAGYSFGQTEAFAWMDGSLTLLGLNGVQMSLASGINTQGIIVGQEGNEAAGSVRLARQGTALPRVASHFAGSTRAMAWTPTDGMVDLNGRIDPSDAEGWALVFATGIDDAGAIVGAAVSNSTMQTVGFVLEAMP